MDLCGVIGKNIVYNGCKYEKKIFSLKNKQSKIYFLYLLLYLVKINLYL